jgi:hypothetical protein
VALQARDISQSIQGLAEPYQKRKQRWKYSLKPLVFRIKSLSAAAGVSFTGGVGLGGSAGSRPGVNRIRYIAAPGAAVK